MAAAASGFPGFVRWTFACGHGAPGLLQVRPATYTPRFFSADEYTTLARLTEIILPSDDGPGAREAGVSEFVDFMVASRSEDPVPVPLRPDLARRSRPHDSRRDLSRSRPCAADRASRAAGLPRPPPGRRRGGPRVLQDAPRLHADGLLHVQGRACSSSTTRACAASIRDCRAVRIPTIPSTGTCRGRRPEAHGHGQPNLRRDRDRHRAPAAAWRSRRCARRASRCAR